MKKRFSALLCALLLLLGTVPYAAALEGETLRRADALATLNLVQGTGTDYALEAPVTRAQAAVLLVRLAGAQETAKRTFVSSGFRDAPDWARFEIAYAAYMGWVNGVAEGEFLPGNPVSANAWFTMLLRLLGYSDTDGDFTVSDAAMFARRMGLTSRTYEGAMTRSDVFQTMYEALTFSYKGQEETVIDRLITSGSCTRSAANALGLLDRELTARNVADRYMSAVFCMELYETWEDLEADKPSRTASGFFISEDGLAVTNYHSIRQCVTGFATLSTGEVFPVSEVLYYDSKQDLAVIRISKTSTDDKTVSAFSCLELVGTDEIFAGDPVYTLGNPLGLGLAVSSGIISDTARIVDTYALPCIMNTADISQGSSGGALLNIYGQVVGVTSGAFAYGNNMYLAVPVDPIMTAKLATDGMTLEEVLLAEITFGPND